jgi:hypothetical protein
MTTTPPNTGAMEEDVRSTRQDINDKMEHLERRLSPSDMMDSVIEFARTNGGAIASGIGRTVREHPVPLVLIGAGITWLALSARAERDDYSGYGGERYYGAGADADRDEGRTGRLRERAAAAGEGLRERASDLGERAGELTEKARERASRAGRSSGRFVKEHPIIVGAAGVMLGAAFAAALPRTSREDHVFGERAERARQAAKEAALREGHRVQEAAKAAVEKARETAERNAPSADDLKRDVERTAKAATGGNTSGTSGPGSSNPAGSTPGTSTPGTSTPGTSTPGGSNPGRSTSGAG